MGYTCLARWPAAPASGLQIVREHLQKNQNVLPIGPWSVSVKSYRSQLGQFPGYQNVLERTMYAITMDGNVFSLLEDVTAPTRAEVLAAAPPGQEIAYLQNPPNYRHTFITARPLGALEQLMTQIKAPWMAVRQPTSTANPRNQATGQQITVEGHTYAIGRDWILRVGNVVLAGGAARGMLFEAEYLPLPVFQSDQFDATPHLMSNFILSVLPPSAVAALVAVAVGDAQWEEVLWDREEHLKGKKDPPANSEDENDPYSWEHDDLKSDAKTQWVGVDRDQRSAYLIVGALRSESLL